MIFGLAFCPVGDLRASFVNQERRLFGLFGWRLEFKPIQRSLTHIIYNYLRCNSFYQSFIFGLPKEHNYNTPLDFFVFFSTFLKHNPTEEDVSKKILPKHP